MRIEVLWREMEAEAASGSPAAWLTRFALPQPTQPVLVALETAWNRRALLLSLPKAAIPRRRDWPDCRGLEVFSAALGGQPHWGVRLRDATCADVFTALAEDVAPRVAAAANPRGAALALLARLRRWQEFLAAGSAGLTTEQQRGLYGELHTLREHFLPSLGAVLSVSGWRAPTAAHQDFQFSTGAVEVKSTSAQQPQTVRISSERQLDDTGVGALFLHVLVLDERELESSSRGDEAHAEGRNTECGAGSGSQSLLTSATAAGESLPELVRGLRQLLQAEARAMELFDDRLLEAGYLDAVAPRYEARRFAVRRELTFRVRHGFPRLTERDLPDGVGDTSYGLSLAACGPFAVPANEMISTLNSGARKPRKRRRD